MAVDNFDFTSIGEKSKIFTYRLFMPFSELLFLALALAVDATIVCFSYGLIAKKGQRVKISFALATSTGLGQFVMPVIGAYLTGKFAHYVASCDHWIIFGVFFILGGKFIWDAYARSDEERESEVTGLSIKAAVLVGLATSIDALASGPILELTNTPIWTSAAWIGGITFVMSLLGFSLTKILRHLPSKWLEIFVGLILIGLGVKVLLEHLLNE